MIDARSILEIVGTYKSYGWQLRRILLTPSNAGLINELGFPGVTVKNSSIDAAWFSREPQDAPISWEIRYLGQPPFALLEQLDENDPDFESKLKAVETRLLEKIGGRRSA